jgi:hypothetical protein
MVDKVYLRPMAATTVPMGCTDQDEPVIESIRGFSRNDWRAGKIDFWYLLLARARCSNRLFERCGHVSVCGHHVRGLRHVRLASQPGAYRLAVGHRESSFATDRHSFTGPAMRCRYGNTEKTGDGGPALEFGGGGGRGLLFGRVRFHAFL